MRLASCYKHYILNFAHLNAAFDWDAFKEPDSPFVRPSIPFDLIKTHDATFE